MNYIKKDVKFLSIPSGMWPNLAFAFASPGIVNKNALAKDIVNGFYKPDDFELIKILFFFRFATFEQLVKLLKIEDENLFRNRINALISRRVINKFILSDTHQILSTTYEDALVVYCLDFTGVEILLHKYSKTSLINYDVSMNIQDSALVGKRLFITEFYVKLLENLKKEHIVSFDPTPEFLINKPTEGGRATVFKIKPSFSFGIQKDDGSVKYYTCEVVPAGDIGLPFREEIKYLDEGIIKTKVWTKDFDAKNKTTVPTLLVFLAGDEDMVSATEIIVNYSGIENFRVSTEDRIKEGLDKSGAFFKNEEGKLKPVKMTSFKKEI
jgi:hypothetical protein